MIIKMRKRYYCEHCKKAGSSSFHMKKHEDGCTLNPGRVCSMCKLMNLEQHSIAYLTAKLGQDCRKHDEDYKFHDVETQAIAPVKITQLRIAALGCPACILAAIRQSTEQRSYEFHYATDCSEFWDQINVAKEFGHAVDTEQWKDHQLEIARGLIQN